MSETTKSADAAPVSNSELVSVMRELIDAINRQNALDAARNAEDFQSRCCPPPVPPAHQYGCDGRVDASGAISMQYGHSAARYNEQMSQVTADKQLQFINQTADRWQLMFRQLNQVTQ